jgi:hypothetical protein
MFGCAGLSVTPVVDGLVLDFCECLLVRVQVFSLLTVALLGSGYMHSMESLILAQDERWRRA